jgi:hypothetical protein
MLKSDQNFWYEFDPYIGQTPIKNLHIPRSKFLSLTNIPIELHTKYLLNFHIKYISDRDQYDWSGTTSIPFDSKVKPQKFMTTMKIAMRILLTFFNSCSSSDKE